MSFALEFYGISWDALKAAMAQRKPNLAQAVEEQQWSRLLNDTDLGQPTHHFLHDQANPLALEPGPAILDGFDEIAEIMRHKPASDHEPPEVNDNAALVFAALVRQLGKPIGAIRHDGSVVRDQKGELPLDFRAMFLDGVAGSCFKDPTLGERLVARPLFGIFHLDFLSWGGLTQSEIAGLLAKFAPPNDQEKQDEDWRGIAPYAEGWLTDLVTALRAAAAAKTDLVTLHLTVQEHYTSLADKRDDELRGDFAMFGKLKSLFGRQG
jgi:hypothetical protein